MSATSTPTSSGQATTVNNGSSLSSSSGNTTNASVVRQSTNTLKLNMNTYKDNTHQMNNYNEIKAVNAYILQVNTQEKARLARTNETFKSAILKERQKFMLNERTIEMGAFRCKVLILSIVVLCLVFIAVGLQLMKKIPSAISGIIISILLVFYLFITILWMLNNKERRNLNWNQYYWPNIEKRL